MTNEEKAKKIVDNIFSSGFNTNRTFYEMAYNSAMRMAEWKDRQMIKKVCEWLKKKCTYIHPRTGKETCVVNLNAFKKAMEE